MVSGLWSGRTLAAALSSRPGSAASRSSELITKTTQPKEGFDSSPQHGAHRIYPLCSSNSVDLTMTTWVPGDYRAMLASLDSLPSPQLGSHRSSTRGVLQSGIPRNTAALFRTLKTFCNHWSAAGSNSRGHGAATTLGHPAPQTPSVISRWPRGNGPGTRDDDVPAFHRPSQRPSVQLANLLWRLSKLDRGSH